MIMHCRKVSLKVCGFVLLGILVVITVMTMWSSPAQAIPAFARKYDLPCSVCHVPGFPKLNDFGNIFRDHGYQIGTKEELPTFEGLTKGYWPVSFRTTVGYQLASLKNAGGSPPSPPGTPTENVNTATGSFGFTGLDVLSFGILARDISFAIVYTPGLSSSGFYTAPSNLDSDLESAWVKLDNLFKSNYLLNVKVGKYELDLPMSEKRLPTLNTPVVIYHYQAGTPYLSAGMNENAFTYGNPNSFALGENQPGLELAGIKETPGHGYFRYSLNALSNANITGPNTGGGRGLNFYGHVTQSYGGYGVISGQRVGIFGMYGDAPTVDNPGCATPGTCGPVSGNGQSFYRVGLDASLTALHQFNLILAGMRAVDSKDLLVSTVGAPSCVAPCVANDAVWYGGFAELDYNPKQLPLWLFIYRYDMIRNDRQGQSTNPKGYNDINSHTLMARYYFHISDRTDTTLHFEYNYTGDKDTGTVGGDRIAHTLLMALDFAL
jgi:hypothetical protein